MIYQHTEAQVDKSVTEVYLMLALYFVLKNKRLYCRNGKITFFFFIDSLLQFNINDLLKKNKQNM